MASRNVLIIGASSQIGLAIARRFRRSGDRVVGVSLEALPGDEAALVAHLAVDCSVPGGGDLAVREAFRLLGGLDVLVLAAAVMPVASASRTTDEQWRTGLDATLSGAFYVTRSALPLMASGASLVAVTSVNATLAAPGLPVYAAAKAGLEGLIRQLALE